MPTRKLGGKNLPSRCSENLVPLRLGKETQHTRENKCADKQDTNADGVRSAGFESDSQIIENPNGPNEQSEDEESYEEGDEEVDA